MKFGEPSPFSVDTANRFMLERVKEIPPGGIGLKETLSVNFFTQTDPYPPLLTYANIEWSQSSY